MDNQIAKDNWRVAQDIIFSLAQKMADRQGISVPNMSALNRVGRLMFYGNVFVFQPKSVTQSEYNHAKELAKDNEVVLSNLSANWIFKFPVNELDKANTDYSFKIYKEDCKGMLNSDLWLHNQNYFRTI